MTGKRMTGIRRILAMRGTGPGTTMDVGAGVVVRQQTKVNCLLFLWLSALLNCILPAGGRKRRRSLSPWERDRYDPRPRYGDDYGEPCFYPTWSLFAHRLLFSVTDTHSRAYGYGSPHRNHVPPPYGGSRRAPPDPHTLDYPASLKQYADWFRYYHPQQAMEEDNADKVAEQEAGDGSKPRNGIKTKWEKYRKDFSAQQVRVGFGAVRVWALTSRFGSYNGCSIIIASHHGSRRSTTRLLNSPLYEHECAKWVGEEGLTLSYSSWMLGSMIPTSKSKSQRFLLLRLKIQLPTVCRQRIPIMPTTPDRKSVV